MMFSAKTLVGMVAAATAKFGCLFTFPEGRDFECTFLPWLGSSRLTCGFKKSVLYDC